MAVNQFDIWKHNRTQTLTRPVDGTTVTVTNQPQSSVRDYIPLFMANREKKGPASITGNKNAWSAALLSMNDVYTPTPLTAAAKVAGMGLAGYGIGKANREYDAGQKEYRDKLVKGLSGGPMDNATIADLRSNPYANDGDQSLLMEMWKRANPTQDEILQRRTLQLQQRKAENDLNPTVEYDTKQDVDGRWWYVPKDPTKGKPIPVEGFDGAPPKVDHQMVTIKGPNGQELPIDLSTDTGKAIYDNYLKTIPGAAQGGSSVDGAIPPPAAPGAAQPQNGSFWGEGGTEKLIKNPFEITKEFNSDKQYQSAQVATATLNSMSKSFRDRSAISDLDFIIGVAKILDPTSVVRTQEGEQVKATQAVPDYLAGRLNQILRGQAELDDKTRTDLYRLAERRTAELQAQGEQQRAFYGNIATKNGYDPETYIPEMPVMPNISVRDAPQNYPQLPYPTATAPQASQQAAPQALPGPFPPRPGTVPGSPMFPMAPPARAVAPPAPVPQAPATTLPAPVAQPPAAPAAPPQAAPQPMAPVAPPPAQMAPGIPKQGYINPNNPLDFGIEQTPPTRNDIPPMPDDMMKAIPTPLWETIVQAADGPEDLMTFMDEIRRNPKMLKDLFPEYYR